MVSNILCLLFVIVSYHNKNLQKSDVPRDKSLFKTETCNHHSHDGLTNIYRGSNRQIMKTLEIVTDQSSTKMCKQRFQPAGLSLFSLFGIPNLHGGIVNYMQWVGHLCEKNVLNFHGRSAYIRQSLYKGQFTSQGLKVNLCTCYIILVSRV